MSTKGRTIGFMTYARSDIRERDARARVGDFEEIYEADPEHELREQAARCMDCGVPFCQSDHGCPIDNRIPEWNELVHLEDWREAYEQLARTNNFPEWTGRICPAPCESACVLGIGDSPVAIKRIERAIVDRAFREGWIQPTVPSVRTGRRVAIVGSGPAGLAAADELNRAGHAVTVFERDAVAGGLLVYGVPNPKLEKRLVKRRVDLLAAGGIEFRTGVEVGRDVEIEALDRDFDGLLLACGALRPRDLSLPGRELRGVHHAMEYLHETASRRLGPERPNDAAGSKDAAGSRVAAGSKDTAGSSDAAGSRDAAGTSEAAVAGGAARSGHAAAPAPAIDCRDKDVVVIGGGDTGADCIATALRHGCRSLVNVTRREQEPKARDAAHPWPGPPGTYRVDYAHAEGRAVLGDDPREYEVLPVGFVGGADGAVRAVRIERLRWERDASGTSVARRTGRIEELAADVVLLAVGFEGHDAPAVVDGLGLRKSESLVPAPEGGYATERRGVFVAGDMRRGASLVVWAIAEGRGAAAEMDAFLARPTP